MVDCICVTIMVDCICNNYGGLMAKTIIIVVVIVLDFSVIDFKLCYYGGFNACYLIKLLKCFKN